MTQPGKEVSVLAHLWGQPQIIVQPVLVAPGHQRDKVRDFFPDRWGEVVMVVRRAADGQVWLMTEESFPQGLYSLPTGGIRYGESIVAALRRVQAQEIGFETRLLRFLAVIRYERASPVDSRKAAPCFVSYVFLLEEVGGDEPGVASGSRTRGFKTAEPKELLDMAEKWRVLSSSSDEFHNLKAWGTFRSLAHQVAGEALIKGQ
jgi:ADP-ribose pyrophosphatase YjhB (NUDIX family)